MDGFSGGGQVLMGDPGFVQNVTSFGLVVVDGAAEEGALGGFRVAVLVKLQRLTFFLL
jgi:hypothetical protein